MQVLITPPVTIAAQKASHEDLRTHQLAQSSEIEITTRKTRLAALTEAAEYQSRPTDSKIEPSIRAKNSAKAPIC